MFYLYKSQLEGSFQEMFGSGASVISWNILQKYESFIYMNKKKLVQITFLYFFY